MTTVPGNEATTVADGLAAMRSAGGAERAFDYPADLNTEGRAMISRREFVKWGAVVPALGTGWHGAFAAAPSGMSGGMDAMLIDTRFPGALDVANAPVPVLRFSGDVTDVWYNDLDTRWRRPGFVLGGITGSDALFVLETLANHQGRRVVSRMVLDLPQVSNVKAVRWIIAPYHISVTS